MRVWAMGQLNLLYLKSCSHFQRKVKIIINSEKYEMHLIVEEKRKVLAGTSFVKYVL